jgi:hypothetical protein
MKVFECKRCLVTYEIREPPSFSYERLVCEANDLCGLPFWCISRKYPSRIALGILEKTAQERGLKIIEQPT